MHPQEITINHGRRRFEALAWGPENGRRVLALHGWLDNAASFARLAPRLPGCRLVAPDMPGHGLSPHRGQGDPYTFIDYVPDVLAAMAGLGWQRCSVLGHSMGAGIAVLLAGAFPERVEKLALIEGIGPLTGAPDTAPAALRSAWEREEVLVGKVPPSYASFDDAVSARAAGGAGISRSAAELLCERGLEQRSDGWFWRNDARLTLPSRLRMTEPQVLAFIGSITAPTLVVRALDGLQFDALKMSRRLALLSVATLVEIGGGHHLHLEEGAEQVASAVLEHFA